MKLSKEATETLSSPAWWTGDRVRKLRDLAVGDGDVMDVRPRFAALMGVSDRTVYRWETEENVLRLSSVKMLVGVVSSHLDQAKLVELLGSGDRAAVAAP